MSGSSDGPSGRAGQVPGHERWAACRGSGRSVELRGFYGGLELGLAAFVLFALARPPWHVPALAVQIATLGGSVVGRIFGLILGGGWEPWIIGLMTVEAAGAALGIIALSYQPTRKGRLQMVHLRLKRRVHKTL